MPPSTHDHDPPRPAVGLMLLLAVLTAVLVLQESSHALLPRQRTNALWMSVLATLGGVLVLRTGAARARAWRDRQRLLGTGSNSFYEPRRDAITQAGTLLGGIAGGLWWGATSWLILVAGIRRRSPAMGLLDLQIAVVVGVLAGGVLGAVAGQLAGEIWERRHRRRRRERHGHA